MADAVVVSHVSNGLNDASLCTKERREYENILKLRDEVFSGTHPRLRLLTKAASTITPVAIKSLPRPAPQLSNGHTTPSQLTIPKEDAHSKPFQISNSLTKPLPLKPSNTRLPSTSGSGSSGLDPIFLTKSEDLVRAEMRLERQRIERSLEEQVYQKKIAFKQRISEQEAVPDFDVSDVLYQAQQLVKPLTANEDTGANGTVSSSDSFDENTFYSSQVNESTTEEADEHPKKWKSRPCKYFFEGSCKKGDSCTFSHDPAFKQKLQGVEALTLDLESIDTSRPASPRDRDRPQMVNLNGNSGHAHPTELTRLAETEDSSFHALEPQKSVNQKKGSYQQPSVHRASNEEGQDPAVGLSTYRSRDNLRYDLSEQTHNRDDLQSPLRYPYPQAAQTRESHMSPSPPNAHHVRVVRNQITSPIAPQPARVSPLAVAKIPRLTQLQHSDHETGAPRSNRRVTSAQYVSNTVSSPSNLRKRRRDPDPQEAARNVAARRDFESPDAFIKEEPLSPPSFLESSAVPSRQYGQVSKEPLILDAASPQFRERIIYQPRKPTMVSQREVADPRGLSTPIVRQVVSRAGQRYDFQEEPDLRRVLSARKIPRIQSPSQDFAHYSVPHPHSARAMSQSYIVHPEIDPVRQYRASVQPQLAMNIRHDHSVSPQPPSNQYSSIRQETMSMAPPPRRIVVDQYGNKYYETPLPSERRTSLAPGPQYFNDGIDSYEKVTRKPSTRTQMTDPYGGQDYVQRLASPGPTSPRYVEYVPGIEPTRGGIRQRTYQPTNEIYPDRNGVVRMVEYPDDRVHGQYEEVLRPREGASRMQSVQPLSTQYEVLNERAPRMQSVRPERQRIVSLGNRREIEPSYSRQVSVRAEEGYPRVPSYAATERPRYQYVSDVPDGRFTDDDIQEELLMEEPRSMGRRPMQRL